MPDGFDMQPEELRQSAAGLRNDASQVDGARGQAIAAAQTAAGAAGTGPLTGAAYDFASAVDKAVGTALRSVADTAHALDVNAATYQRSDGAASHRLSDVPLPGFDGPR